MNTSIFSSSPGSHYWLPNLSCPLACQLFSVTTKSTLLKKCLHCTWSANLCFATINDIHIIVGLVSFISLILHFVPHLNLMEQIKRTKQFPSKYKFWWLCEVKQFISARPKFRFGGRGIKCSSFTKWQISNLMKFLRKKSISHRGRFVKKTHIGSVGCIRDTAGFPSTFNVLIDYNL